MSKYRFSYEKYQRSQRRRKFWRDMALVALMAVYAAGFTTGMLIFLKETEGKEARMTGYTYPAK